MATNNSSNQDYQNNSDGAQIGGGVTKRILKWLGADITLTGSGSNTYNFPAAADTLVGRTSTDTLTNKDVSSSTNTFPNFIKGQVSGIKTYLVTVATSASAWTAVDLTPGGFTSTPRIFATVNNNGRTATGSGGTAGWAEINAISATSCEVLVRQSTTVNSATTVVLLAIGG